ASEENRGDFSLKNGRVVDVGSHDIENFDFFADIRIHMGSEAVLDIGVGKIMDFQRGAKSPTGGTFEKMNLVLDTVEYALELGPGTEWPVDGKGLDLKHFLQLVEQFKRWTRWSIHFVNERENRNLPHPADFKQFACLYFNPFPGINNHDHCIDGSQNTIGVFG